MRYKAQALRTYTSKESRERAAFVESARRALPVGTYLAMLNHAALTGELPVVDVATGQLTSKTEQISTDQRLDIARYLIDKAVPNLIRVEPAGDDGLKDANAGNMSAEDIANLPSDSLQALIIAQTALASQPVHT